MTLATLLLLLSLSWTDAANLTSDDFDSRQRAEHRLCRSGLLAVPALAWASVQPDLEQRRRALRVLQPLRHRGERIGITVLATWLFYGPCETGNCRYLIHNQRFAQRMPDWLHHRLRDEAVRFGLMLDWEHITLNRLDTRSGWINTCRHRAYRIPSPTTH